MRPRLLQLTPVFVLSGASALIVEMMWMRWFRLLFGATVPATSATLVAFFVGHAIGAALCARFLARSGRPLRLCGFLAWGGAAWATATPLLLSLGESAAVASYQSLLESPVLLVGLRFALVLLATLPAAASFGAMFPVFGSATLRGPEALGTTGNAVYALYTTGAVLGTVLAAFWLPEWLGLRGSYSVGVLASIAAGTWALVLSRSEPGSVSRVSSGDPRIDAAGASRVRLSVWGLAALSGFGSLGAQVLFVHAFGLVLNQSAYAFGAVLVTVQTGLVVGAVAVSWLIGRHQLNPRMGLGFALGLSALSLAGFPALLHGVTDGLRYVGSEALWLGFTASALFTVAVTAGWTLIPAAAVLPFILALAGATSDSKRGDSLEGGARIGAVIAANTVGAIGGALCVPFFLLPAAGLWGAFLGLAILYGLPAVLLHAGSSGRWLRNALLAAGWVAILGWANPLSYPLTRLHPNERVVHQESTVAGVVSV